MSRILTMILAVLVLSGCSEMEFASHIAKRAIGDEDVAASSSQRQGNFKIGKPYQVEGRTYYPKESYDLVETGIASWYGPGFHGKHTASGERFDTNELTAAHRTLQMPSMVRVTNLENGRSVVVRVNDRGPFARGRVIDVSQRAAELLGFKAKGTAKVKLEVLSQESMRLAEMAKRGENTSGFELAANQGQAAPTDSTGLGIEPISSEPLSSPVSVHETTDGRFMPDPVVTQVAVRPTNIYVQAGSFSRYENAQRLSDTLRQIGKATIQEATVNGKQFYRVRVGPINNVDGADKMLNRVVGMGNNNAIIVVD